MRNVCRNNEAEKIEIVNVRKMSVSELEQLIAGYRIATLEFLPYVYFFRDVFALE